MGEALFFSLILIVTFSRAQSAIDPDLFEELSQANATSQDVLVNFEESNTRPLNIVKLLTFDSRPNLISTLVAGLQTHANQMQAPLQQLVQSMNLESKSFFAGNQMVVKAATLPQVLNMNAVPGTARIQKVPQIKLFPVIASVDLGTAADDNTSWGVARIGAQKAHAMGVTGEKVVVANIDTGVRGTHEALKDNFRGNHSWFDATGNTTTPNDNDGHGTHTMGTICGSHGIGVAPGAKWMACKACTSDGCKAVDLMACGQWVLCPDPGVCKMSPHAVSNSWGSTVPLRDPFYDPTIDAWRAAKIVPVFAIGNSGPVCSTAGSPGDGEKTFSVGSTDMDDKISTYSSKGPALPSRIIKPDIAAPGRDIRSAWSTGDTDYNTISGTSMATPHVAGAIALLLSITGVSSREDVVSYCENQIKTTADKPNIMPTCRNTDLKGSTTTSLLELFLLNLFSKPESLADPYPNNAYGNGILMADKAVEKTVKENM